MYFDGKYRLIRENKYGKKKVQAIIHRTATKDKTYFRLCHGDKKYPCLLGIGLTSRLWQSKKIHSISITQKIFQYLNQLCYLLSNKMFKKNIAFEKD